MKRFKSQTTQSGFTLIELLIAMTVFLILIGIVVSIFISSLRTQRAMVALMATNDNASLTLEQMARELRTAFDFSIIASPPVSSGSVLKFKNANSEFVSYRLNNYAIERGICTLSNLADCDLPSEFSYAPITGTNVKISDLRFIIFNPANPDDWPPRITITLSVTPKQANLEDIIKTNIQTTISARNI